MATPDSGTADTRAEQDDLEKLATELTARGYHARLIAHPSRLPYLDVSNPRAAQLTEKVYAQAGSYFWPWAEPIASCDQPARAAVIIARVLRTTDGN
jgi:hypothetical protein